MDTMHASEAECAYEEVLLLADDELLYAAPRQKNSQERGNWDAGSHATVATHLSALLRQYIGGADRMELGAPLAPLQRRFEIIAQTNPGANAVRFNGRSVSYGELDSQADALALHLQRGGLSPGSFCVVSMEPSLAQVRAILAILKAGAACLQFDPSMSGRPMAVVRAVFRPSIQFTHQGEYAGSSRTGIRTIRCDDDAAQLPHGWPDEFPVDARTPAHALATASDSGGLCISVRTHKALGACLEAMRGICPPLASVPYPACFWRTLSEGAQLTIAAR